MWLMVGKQLTLRGFPANSHSDLRPEFVATASGWLRDGSLVARETVVEGRRSGGGAGSSIARRWR
jgi:NADPH-dependent curcumin reductase CurA